MFKLTTILLAVAVTTSMAGCNITRFFNSINGLELGLKCELDADFGVHNCKPRGKFLRGPGLADPIDVADMVMNFSVQGTQLNSLPNLVTVTTKSNSIVVQTQSALLQQISATGVAFANPAAVSAWLNSNPMIDEITFETSNFVANATPGTNTITASTVVSGASVASASQSTYVGSKFILTPELN